MASTNPDAAPDGPILFAYDGSDLAAFAIAEAGRQLAPGRDTLVVCVWQPADVGFLPVGGRHLNATQAADVHKAAEETASYGAGLAKEAGFRSQCVTVEAAPTWKGIVKIAKEREASLIVLGSHRRTGIRGHLLGSVAAAVVSHSAASVLVIHQPSEAEES